MLTRRRQPEDVGRHLVEGGGEEHGDTMLFAGSEEWKVLQRQCSTTVRNGGGGELLVLHIAANNAEPQAPSVS